MTHSPQTASVELLLAHGEFVRSLAGALCRDDATADDVAQESMAAALRNPPAADRPLEPWLATVVRNCARKVVRGRLRREAREVATARTDSDSEGDPAVVVVRLEEQRILVEEVARLDEPFRTAILLRYFDGLQAAEIGRRTGVPAATVRTRVLRGLERLREALDRRHGGRRDAWMALLLPPGAWAPRRSFTWSGAAVGAAAVAGLAVLLAWPALSSSGGQPSLPANLARTAPALGGDRSSAAFGRSRPRASVAVGGSAKSDAPAATSRSVRGRVVDPAGASVAGATAEAHTLVAAALPVSGNVTGLAGAPVVEATADAPEREFAERRRGMTASTVTAADGTFDLSDVPSGVLRIRAIRAGVGVGTAEVSSAEGDVEGLRIELRAGIRLFGKLTTHDGAVPSGAEVFVERAASGKSRLVPADGKGPVAANIAWEAEATVNPREDGTWETLVPWDTCYFRVVARAAGRLDAGPAILTLAKDRPEVRVDLVFVDVGTLDGEVVAADSGLPIAGASVTSAAIRPLPLDDCETRPAGPPSRAVTDAEGRFRLPLVCTGPVLVAAGARGRATTSVRATVPGTVRIALPLAGEMIEGRVIDQDGRPVAGALVSALPEEEEPRSRGGAGFASADSEGRFRIAGLRDGLYALVIRPPAGREEELSASRVRGTQPGASPTPIVLKRALAIEGHVTSPSGNAIESGSVRAEPLDPEADPEPVSWRSGRLGEGGRFSVRGLAPGFYRLRLFGWGEDLKPTIGIIGGPTRPPSLLLSGGDRVEAGTRGVTLRVEAGLHIRGRVIDERGAPVVQAQVWVRAPTGKDIILVYSGEDGRIDVGGLDEGTGYAVEAFRAGFRAARSSGVRAGGDSITLVMERGISASGCVIDADGEPLAGARVELTPSDGADASSAGLAETTRTGEFTVGNLRAVEYRVRVALWVPATREVLWVEAGRIRGGASGVVLCLPR